MIALEWLLVAGLAVLFTWQVVLPIVRNQRIFPFLWRPAREDERLVEAEQNKVAAAKRLQAEVIDAEARYADKKAAEVKTKIK